MLMIDVDDLDQEFPLVIGRAPLHLRATPPGSGTLPHSPAMRTGTFGWGLLWLLASGGAAQAENAVQTPSSLRQLELDAFRAAGSPQLQLSAAATGERQYGPGAGSGRGAQAGAPRQSGDTGRPERRHIECAARARPCATAVAANASPWRTEPLCPYRATSSPCRPTLSFSYRSGNYSDARGVGLGKQSSPEESRPCLTSPIASVRRFVWRSHAAAALWESYHR
jgi:hypothetical protein